MVVLFLFVIKRSDGGLHLPQAGFFRALLAGPRGLLGVQMTSEWSFSMRPSYLYDSTAYVMLKKCLMFLILKGPWSTASCVSNKCVLMLELSIHAASSIWPPSLAWTSTVKVWLIWHRLTDRKKSCRPSIPLLLAYIVLLSPVWVPVSCQDAFRKKRGAKHRVLLWDRSVEAIPVTQKPVVFDGDKRSLFFGTWHISGSFFAEYFSDGLKPLWDCTLLTIFNAMWHAIIAAPPYRIVWHGPFHTLTGFKQLSIRFTRGCCGCKPLNLFFSFHQDHIGYSTSALLLARSKSVLFLYDKNPASLA